MTDQPDNAQLANDEADPGATLEEVGIDYVLAELVGLINAVPGLGLGITLHVGGLVVSGNLIAGHSYFKELQSNFEGDGNADDDNAILRTHLADFLGGWATIYPNDLASRDEADAQRKTSFIHLGAVSVYLPGPGNSQPINQRLWRGRLSSVDGWSVGRLEGSAT